MPVRASKPERKVAPTGPESTFTRENAPLVIEGSGADPAVPRPAEKSYFSLGMNEKAARILGKLWRQDAAVWVGEDAVPTLILPAVNSGGSRPTCLPGRGALWPAAAALEALNLTWPR
jgi:hypothetical protein